MPAPTNLTATPALTQIALAWTPGGGHTQQRIDRDNQPLVALGPEESSYVDQVVMQGETHLYHVVGIGEQEERSDQAQATVPLAAPSAPAIVSGPTEQNGLWYVELEAANNSTQQMPDYVVRRIVNDGPPEYFGPSGWGSFGALKWADNQLQPGDVRRYAFQLTSPAASDWSGETTVQVPLPEGGEGG